MASTSILPLQLGQAILGRALEPDAPAPEYVQIDGECWKLVTDPAAIQAAQDALQAREKANEAFAMAQYAPRIANRPPAAADAEGKAPGAGWLEYDPATQLLKQMWRWTGQAWEELPMDPVMIPIIQIGTGTAGDLTADRLIVTNEFVARVAQILELSVENLVVTEGATINELVALSIASATAEFQTAYIQNLRSNGAVIDEAVIGDLAANIITSGLFRTADEGQRLEIDSSGLVMYGLDPDGIDYEMVRIGPSGDNLITLGDTTISPSGIQAIQADVEDITIGGDSLSTILAAYPRGIVGFAHTAGVSDWHGNGTEIRRLEVNVTVQPGRRYRATFDQHYVETRTGTSRTTWVERLKYGPPGSMVEFATARSILIDSTTDQTVPSLVGYLETSTLSSDEDWTIGLTTQGPSGRDIRLKGKTEARIRLTVEDIGPTIAATGEVLMVGGTSVEGAPAPPPPDPPKTKRYTKTYSSTGYRVYDEDGSARTSPDVVQGLYAGGPSRFNRRGGWLFPSMTGDLAGASIEKIRVKLYCNHTNSSAGSTVNVCTWGGVMQSSLAVRQTVSGWKRNTAKWLPLPSSTHAGFKSGAIDGIGVKPTSTSSTQYARFATSAKIEITFTK